MLKSVLLFSMVFQILTIVTISNFANDINVNFVFRRDWSRVNTDHRILKNKPQLWDAIH